MYKYYNYDSSGQFCFCIEKKNKIYVLTTGSSLDTLHQTWYPKVNGKNHLDFCRGNQCDANFQVGPGFTLTHVSIFIFFSVMLVQTGLYVKIFYIMSPTSSHKTLHLTVCNELLQYSAKSSMLWRFQTCFALNIIILSVKLCWTKCIRQNKVTSDLQQEDWVWITQLVKRSTSNAIVCCLG